MSNIKTLIAFCRVIDVILGFVILVLGIFSHYRSSWVSLHVKSELVDLRPSKLHELCEIKYFYGNCPDIILEQFYVAVISINFIFSFLGLLAYCLWYMGVEGYHPLKWVDLVYHGTAAVFLLAGAIVYIISAVQIREFSGGVEYPAVNFRTEEKFVTAGLTILQCLLYVLMGLLIGKCKVPNLENLIDNPQTNSIPMAPATTFTCKYP